MRRPVATNIIFISLLVASFVIPVFGQTLTASSPRASSNTSTVRLALPLKDGSLRFAVMGDTGSGSNKQQQVADMMVQYQAVFPFEFVLMMGDNLYGGETPRDFENKFSNVYKKLLDDKVKFYATLGNHDMALQANYQNFNMNGKEYYRFKKGNVAFYCLNSNYMDKKQVQWLEQELAKDTSEWKVMFFHHPPYSSAKKHGSDSHLREVLEPMFVKYGVNVVLTGHDHVYERIKPQKGIYYFVSGAGGKLRSGDVKDSSPLTDKSFDRDMHFMLFEVAGDQMYFQAISRTGNTIDAGVISRKRTSS
jgi:predicted MPP superfamily phosphohydrolase